MPNISVVVPVYNVEPYLRKCLESIRAQTFLDFEAICIDDGSTDESCRILEEYAMRDSRFKVLRNPCNIGAGKTRNIGLRSATANYVMFLDSDDWYDKEYFRKMHDKAEETGADIVICRYAKFNERNGTIDLVPDMDPGIYSAIKDGCSVMTIPEHIFMLFRVAPQIKIYRRRFLLEEGLRFQDLPKNNDTYFGILSLACAKRIDYLPQTFVYYRYEREGSTTIANGNEVSCIYEALLQCCRELHRKRNLWDKCKKSFFDFAMINVMYVYRRISSDKLKSEFQEFWRSRGLKDIGMGHCEPTDFTSRMYVDIWENIVGSKMGNVEDSTSYKILERNLPLLKTCKNIIIYGAGKVGMETAQSLQALGLRNYFFAQTEILGGEKRIGQHIVHRIEEFVPEKDESVVLIAVETKKPRDMIETLDRLQFGNYLPVGDG